MRENGVAGLTHVRLQMSRQISDIYAFILHSALMFQQENIFCFHPKALQHLRHEQRRPATRSGSCVIVCFDDVFCLSADISSMVCVGRAAGACSLMIWPQANLQPSVNTTREESVPMETDAGELLVIEICSSADVLKLFACILPKN